MKINFDFPVYHNDYQNAGIASSEIKKILTQVGLPFRLIRKIVISSYEAEMNLVIHSNGGKLKLEIDQESVVLISEDCGPGIADIELALSEGYSTADAYAREMGFGAGMGLPNMKKNSDFFDIKSSPDGTIVYLSWVIKNETFN
ncbi:MAG TPA: ATP-binding protein [Haloplasmataceae bacterium]